MKKSKLSFQKFKIAALKNPSQIIGGTGAGNNDDDDIPTLTIDTGTGGPIRPKDKCAGNSRVIIKG